MSTEEFGLLVGHCDSCGQPVDYCTCTPGACPGCDHCQPEEE